MTIVMRTTRRPATATPVGDDRVPARALRLSVLLAAVTATAAMVTLFVPDLLSGPAVMNGSAKGTALVELVLGVPLLVAAAFLARHGSARALAVATGVTAYLVYNGVMFVFGTPFNAAFLLYEAMLGLALWSLLARGMALHRQARELAADVPWWVPAYIGLVVVLNTALWLAQVLPALLDDHPSDWLEGTGLTTNPVIAQDLAFWLPAMAWLAWGAWQRRPPLVALAAAGAVFWVVEAVGVAVDQWWGHHADPSSSWASSGAVVLFIVTALVGVLPMVRLLRAVPDRHVT